nr:hypothetical protein [Chenggangzhangella methanolivorans]
MNMSSEYSLLMKLLVGRHLAKPQRQPVVDLLVPPEFEQPRGRSRADVVHRHEVADILVGEILAVDLEHAGVEPAALDAEDLLAVELESEVQQPAIGRVLAHAAVEDRARVGEVEAREPEALVGQRVARVLQDG